MIPESNQENMGNVNGHEFHEFLNAGQTRLKSVEP